jgi:nitroimidazol reductase NimA-like FMN-containing flavoprotein (pyridoxamine 5'-phosphate oxidase superfamily)
MNKIRRQDRALTENEAVKILDKGEYGILSMCTTNNTGYGVPLNYVSDDSKIYFHCAIEGSKLNYLRANNKVTFCVVGNTKLLPSEFGTLYESAIVSGAITEVEGEEKRRALIKINEKYSGEFIEEGYAYIDKYYDRVKILKLTIDSVTGKSRKK